MVFVDIYRLMQYPQQGFLKSPALLDPLMGQETMECVEELIIQDFYLRGLTQKLQ